MNTCQDVLQDPPDQRGHYGGRAGLVGSADEGPVAPGALAAQVGLRRVSSAEKLFYFVTNTSPDDPLCWNKPVFAWAMDQRHSQFNCRTTHLIYIFHHLLRKFGHKRCNGIFHS